MDKWLEEVLKQYLHSQRDYIINKMIAKFEKQHPGMPMDELRKKLETEADRLYAIVDRSILRDRIQRSKYVFWGTAIASVITIGSLGGFTSGSVLPFISPLVSALISWFLSNATISISYNQRIKGGMDSMIILYEKSLPVEEASEGDSVIDINDRDADMQSSAYVTQKLKEQKKNDVADTISGEDAKPIIKEEDHADESESSIVSYDPVIESSHERHSEDDAESSLKESKQYPR